MIGDIKLTCEIALMNRQAIALAADSAVTTIGERKIFPSAEKLFSLSNQPIGIMVYGNADLAEVPWETVIKRYKNYLKDKTFNTLKEYGDSFIKFLEENKMQLIPETAQERYMQETIKRCFINIVDNIDISVENYIDKHGAIDEKK